MVGEELSVPLALIQQRRLDGLWNEQFKRLVRNAVLGRNDDREPSFEWTVRRMIDCRLLGFGDGAQAVNYLGSHDVEGFGNERLFNFLQNNGVWQTEERIKLAFACLLTAVGIPQILAGDEFADQHDLSVGNPAKQRDAVNYDRVDEPFRRRVFDYVARLVTLRTSESALADQRDRVPACRLQRQTRAGLAARPRRQQQPGHRGRQLLRLPHRYERQPTRNTACPTGPRRQTACAGMR